MTKEELVSKLTAAIGGTAYGDALIEEASETFGDADKKYGQDMKDRLDDRLGILKAYARIHADHGEEAKATAEEDKIAIIEKALAAIK
jgi:NTP pyrophosphatase (non-canonical NTP hydrolase)